MGSGSRLGRFVCRYLASKEIGRGIRIGLQVVEDRNSANDKQFSGRDGVPAGTDRNHNEVSVLALRLLRSRVACINTLLVQRVLNDPRREKRMGCRGRPRPQRSALDPRNLYGRFLLDMGKRLHAPGPRRERGMIADWARRDGPHPHADQFALHVR
ncbi:Tn3 family transposase [Amycolatopsis sp. NPDC059090]|uniref:Tn3 family transposase n=1 Tax=Amycolatopsis sp. NPDC059090 TaxID=3346723 RepID=UPI00366B543C